MPYIAPTGPGKVGGVPGPNDLDFSTQVKTPLSNTGGGEGTRTSSSIGMRPRQAIVSNGNAQVITSAMTNTSANSIKEADDSEKQILDLYGQQQLKTQANSAKIATMKSISDLANAVAKLVSESGKRIADLG